MTMLRKTITISEPMEHWIKDQIATGRYANDSEYLRDLIRRDQDAHARVGELRALIDDGLHSGVSTSAPADIRERVERRLKADGRL